MRKPTIILVLSVLMGVSLCGASHVAFGPSYQLAIAPNAEGTATGDGLPADAGHFIGLGCNGFVGRPLGFFYDISLLVPVQRRWFDHSAQQWVTEAPPVFDPQVNALLGIGLCLKSDGLTFEAGLGTALNDVNMVTNLNASISGYGPKAFLEFGAGCHLGISLDLTEKLQLMAEVQASCIVIRFFSFYPTWSFTPTIGLAYRI